MANTYCPIVPVTADTAVSGLCVILHLPAQQIPYVTLVVEVVHYLVGDDLVYLDEHGVGEVHTDTL